LTTGSRELLQESVKEWKVSSLMFEKEEAATKMVKEVKAGRI